MRIRDIFISLAFAVAFIGGAIAWVWKFGKWIPALIFGAIGMVVLVATVRLIIKSVLNRERD